MSLSASSLSPTAALAVCRNPPVTNISAFSTPTANAASSNSKPSTLATSPTSSAPPANSAPEPISMPISLVSLSTPSPVEYPRTFSPAWSTQALSSSRTPTGSIRKLAPPSAQTHGSPNSAASTPSALDPPSSEHSVADSRTPDAVAGGCLSAAECPLRTSTNQANPTRMNTYRKHASNHL